MMYMFSQGHAASSSLNPQITVAIVEYKRLSAIVKYYNALELQPPPPPSAAASTASVSRTATACSHLNSNLFFARKPCVSMLCVTLS